LLTQEVIDVQQSLNHSLPFAEYILDRWQKTRALGYGEGSSIYDSALVLHDIEAGSNAWGTPCRVVGRATS